MHPKPVLCYLVHCLESVKTKITYYMLFPQKHLWKVEILLYKFDSCCQKLWIRFRS